MTNKLPKKLREYFTAMHKRVEERGDMLVGFYTDRDPTTRKTVECMEVLHPLEEGGYAQVKFDYAGHLISNYVYAANDEPRYRVYYNRENFQRLENGKPIDQAHIIQAQRLLGACEEPIRYRRMSYISTNGEQVKSETVRGTVAPKLFRQQHKKVLLAVADLIPAEERYHTEGFVKGA